MNWNVLLLVDTAMIFVLGIAFVCSIWNSADDRERIRDKFGRMEEYIKLYANQMSLSVLRKKVSTLEETFRALVKYLDVQYKTTHEEGYVKREDAGEEENG